MIKVKKIHLEEKFIKSTPPYFQNEGGSLKYLFCEKWLEIALMSTHCVYEGNLPYKSKFSIRKPLHDKTSKTKMDIYSRA